jgi:hypothetical protein
MGPKGEPDSKTNWSTNRRPQDKLNSTQPELVVSESFAQNVILIERA